MGNNKKIVLCADTETLIEPALIGLNINVASFNNLDWLIKFSNANLAREYCFKNKDIAEAWLISSDEIDAINLAAGIKKKCPSLCVCLVSFDISGSLKSRADVAHIDKIYTKEKFVERFNAFFNLYMNNARVSPQQSAKSQKTMQQNTNIPKLAQQNSNTPISAQQNSRPPKIEVPKINTCNQSKGFLLPVVSATGGSGKSSVAAMTAILSQLAGNKTLLIDGSLQFSELKNMVDVKNSITIDKLLTAPEMISQLQPTETAPALLSAPDSPELSETIMAAMPNLVENLRCVYECIVVNTCSYWNELTASLLENASKTIFLLDQRPTAIAASKQAIDLCTRCAIASSSFCYVLNRCSKSALYSAIDVSCTLGGAPVAEILDGGIEVDNAFMKKSPVSLIESKNPFALSLWNIVNTILPRKAEFSNIDGGGRLSKKQYKQSKRFSIRKKRA